MYKNYVKLAIRHILRHKTVSAINIFGLSIAVACCMLVYTFVRHEWSYDGFHEKSDRIYRILTEYRSQRKISAHTLFPLNEALTKAFPGIEQICHYSNFDGIVKQGDKIFEQAFHYTEPAFFEMFSFPLRFGNPQTALDAPNSVILTEDMALKYYGKLDILGETILINFEDGFQPFTVTGVAENLPKNSSTRFDFLFPYSKLNDYSVGERLNNWRIIYGSNTSFILIGKEVKPAEFSRRFAQFRDERDRRQRSLSLQPLADIHFSLQGTHGLAPDTEVLSRASRPEYSYILGGIAFAILMIACINFAILATGSSSNRLTEVGMRKVMGAVRSQIGGQFIGETVIYAVLAMGLGCGIAELAFPLFNRFTGAALTLSDYLDTPSVFVFVGFILLVALFAGSYPALVFSRFKAVNLFRSRLRLGGANWFARSLVVLQFGLTILFIICAMLMSQQMYFIQKMNLGLHEEQVIVVPVSNRHIDDRREVFELYKDQLKPYANILSISASFRQIFRSGVPDIEPAEQRGRHLDVAAHAIDYDYIKTLGIQLLQGRDLSREIASDFARRNQGGVHRNVIVNEALIKAFGWKEPLGQKFTFDDDYYCTVVGVVGDFHYLPLHHSIEPFFLMLDPDYSFTHFFIRVSPHEIPATIALLREKWEALTPSVPFDYYFLDDFIEQQYRADQRWATVIRFASFLAVFIACMGLFGQATLTAVNRTKEIGIRKVLGASVSGIIGLLSKDFVKLVLLANLVAWPIAWYAMNQWLQNFAYRIGIGWWVFALAGATALLIALVTVSSQAVRAALANPVESLRYE